MENLRLLVFNEDGYILHDATKDLTPTKDEIVNEEILKQSVMSEKYGRFFLMR